MSSLKEIPISERFERIKDIIENKIDEEIFRSQGPEGKFKIYSQKGTKVSLISTWALNKDLKSLPVRL